MIEQFFTEEEGPDRDWQEDNYEIYDEDGDCAEMLVDK